MTHYILYSISFFCLCIGTFAQTQLTLTSSVGIEGGNVYSIDKKGSEIIVGTQSGVFWSTDYGIQWNSIPQSVSIIPFTKVQITDPGVYVCVSDRNIYIYKRADNTFTPLPSLLDVVEKDGNITALYATPTMIMAGTSAGYLLNYGIAQQRWTIVLDSSNSQSHQSVTDIIRAGSKFYVSIGQELMRWNGNAWLKVTPTLNESEYMFVQDICEYGNHVIAATTQGIIRSTDEGITWQKFNQNLSEETIAIRLAGGGDYLAIQTLSDGIKLYDTTRNEWIDTDINNDYDEGILSLHRSQDGLYVGLQTQGIIHSANGRNSFAPMNQGLHDVSVHGLAIFGSTLYAATSNGIFTSTNNGTDWFGPTMKGIAFNDAVVHNNTIFMASEKGIFRYNSPSNTWDTAGFNGVRCQSFTQQGNTLYVTTADLFPHEHNKSGIFFTNDGGVTWQNITHNLLTIENISEVVRVTQAGQTLFAGTNAGLFRKNTQDTQWQKIYIGNFLAVISDMVIDEGTIVLTLNQGSVIRSTDNGITWNDWREGLENETTYVIMNGISIRDGLYYLYTNVGIFTRMASSSQWQKISDIFGALWLSYTDNRIFVGTQKGLYYQNIVTSDIDEDNQENNAVMIYPNPASGTMTINSEESEILSIEYFTVEGQSIMSVPAPILSPTPIDISSLPTGTYIARITTVSGMYHHSVTILP